MSSLPTNPDSTPARLPANAPEGPRPESPRPESPRPESPREDFLREIVAADQRRGTYGGRVVTRFPPEPNGYLHIGHAKSICLNFGIAQQFGGVCHLRFDDTNPETEDMEYVESIQRDVHWLGFDWGEHLYFASDYYEQLYQWAEQLIIDGKAYVDDLNEQEIRDYRGTVTEPGRPSPWRDRSVPENLDLFRRMRAGEFTDGARVLRAKGDMASPNMKMRDPLLYRIRHATHYRTGDTWCLYPMYDYAHPLSDQIEQITHSICTLEFENNRDIYDWLLDNLVGEPRPHQHEFARLNLDYTVMSKRRLLQLVDEGRVEGWDDPRLPTIAGLRRRGVTPSAIRAFADRIGIAKANSRVEMGLFESILRDDLNPVAPRVLAVLRPLKLLITNYPEGQVEWLDAPFFPHDVPREGSRAVPFSRTLYIERTDFMEDPPKDFYRLAPGREVRLRHAYIVTCTDVVKDAAGEIVEVHATYDPATRSGAPVAADGSRKRSQTAIQWVSAAHALPMRARLYDRLLRVADPDAEGLNFLDALNPNSMEIVDGLVEPGVAADAPETRYQFERHGYFWRDPETPTQAGRLLFNRIIGLRDSWSRASSDARPARPAQAPKGSAAPSPAKTQSAAPADGNAGTLEEGSDGKLRIPPRTPELEARRTRYGAELGLRDEEAELLTRSAEVADFFEATLAHTSNSKASANWITHDLLPALDGRSPSALPLKPDALAALVRLVDDGKVSTAAARTVFAELLANGGDPSAIVQAQGLTQVADSSALLPMIAAVMAANSDKVAQYRAGKTGLLGFFTGQVMKQTRGTANPQVVQDLLVQALEQQAA